jgi:hypothetical protein
VPTGNYNEELESHLFNDHSAQVEELVKKREIVTEFAPENITLLCVRWNNSTIDLLKATS